MGFDLDGVKPTNDLGVYFRNNIWWWRPLWSYVCANTLNILTQKDRDMGSCNDGHRISKAKAEKIAKRLTELCNDGSVARYEKEYMDTLRAIPDEKCDLCKGTGKRNDLISKDKCNKCYGKGKIRPFETWYSFSKANVLSFAGFCQFSGGFRIF